MKKVIGIAAIATFMVACNQAPDPATVQSANQLQIDTTGLAAFQAWRAQGELQQLNAMNQEAEAPKTVEKHYYYNNGTRTTASRSSGTTARRSSSSGTRSSGTSSGSGTTARKDGWSKSAKGAVIGGVTGGVAGAVINKRNRAVGGAVGAVVGAAGGYVIGRQMDKKDGRY